MCGIVGFVDRREIAEKHLQRMTDALVHRGPDAGGLWLKQTAKLHVGLGHRRLSIIDLSDAGHQPMCDVSEDIWITFNGEIYNYQELKADLIAKGYVFRSATDTEVIIYGYREYGVDFFRRMNGMFALGIWDARNETLVLCRDRFGQKPLYYWENSGGIAFASEIKALLEHPYIERGIDYRSLSRYLAYEYLPAPYSIYKDVKKLPQGCMMVWKDFTATIKPYWQPRFTDLPKKMDEREMGEELIEKLKRAVSRRLMSDVPLGVFLSGGIDSSSMIALLSEMMPADRIETFSIGFREQSFDESSWARKVAEKFGTNHREEILTAKTMLDIQPEIWSRLDEPFADASIIPTYLLSRFTRQHVTVALGGDGGDELFAGYDPFLAHYWADRYEILPEFLHKAIVKPLAMKLPVSTRNMSLDFKVKHFLKGVYHKRGIRNQIWLGAFTPEQQRSVLTDDVLHEIAGMNPYDQIVEEQRRMRFRDWLDEIGWNYQKFYLANDILVKVDRASMMVSLEARTPFLDVEFAEFANSLPSGMKMKGTVRKYLLKKALESRLPRDVLYRRKKGFGIPLAKWIKHDLRDGMEAVFQSRRIEEAGIFRPDAIQTMLKEHLDGKKDNRKPLWALYVFEKWRENFG